jgi:hypothetical protein
MNWVPSPIRLRPERAGSAGVIRAPVAKTAVVGSAVTPGRAPVAQTVFHCGRTHLARVRTIWAEGCLAGPVWHGERAAEAIEMYFDEKAEADARRLWQLLAGAGLPSLATLTPVPDLLRSREIGLPPRRRVELDEGHAAPRHISGGGSRVGDRDISWAAQRD